MNKRILMIGLDGATFDVIDPLIEEGWMPNLAKLITKGASGRILSTIPPISGPAWVSLATGRKPETTSIYDFNYRKDKSYELQPVSSLDYAGRAVWDYLSKAGKKVGMLNYPMIIPPYKVNGFMSAGLWASEGGEYTFPLVLKQELNKAAGGRYELTVDYRKSRYNDTKLFLDDLQIVLAKKLCVATHLMKEKQWDFFWLVISETDWLQHIMWRHLDENHSLYEGQESRKFQQRFKKIWQMIDEAIGKFVDIAGDQSNIVICSDHGFGPNEEIFKLNVWLEREGYLVWQKRQSKAFSLAKRAAFTYCKAIAKGLRLDKLVPKLYRSYGRVTRNKLTEMPIDHIDMEKSIAFDPGHTIPFGGIYINDRLIDTPKGKQKISREIVEKLCDWGRKNNVKIETWQRSSSLVGQTNAGPDLIIGMNDWGCVLLKDQSKGEIFERKSYSTRHTGCHRIDGVFIGAGPDIKSCTVNEAYIYDIAPTILYLFNQPVPQSMDGQVLTSIINEESLDKNPVKFQSEVRDDKRTDTTSMPKEMTQQEKDIVQQQLKDLGYM